MSGLGPVTYEQNQGSVFLGRDYLKDKNFSDQVAFDIDKETRKIIEECYVNAKNCLMENRDLLEKIAYYLEEIETITKQDIDEINETGSLKWYDDQKAAKEALKESQTKEETTVENTEKSSSEESTTTSSEENINTNVETVEENTSNNEE
jgi:cell division protease FtsH